MDVNSAKIRHTKQVEGCKKKQGWVQNDNCYNLYPSLCMYVNVLEVSFYIPPFVSG